METPAGVRVNRSAVLASLGLSTNLLWCTLAGHTGGFPSSLHDLDPAVNPRIFFLLGILIVGVAFAVGPRWLRERDQPFSYVLPLASSIGTASFALASNQSLFDPIFLAIAGLIMFGAGYFWIASRFYLLLARTQTFACTAWCIVAALGMETLVLPIARYAVPPVWQIAVTIALPLVSAALFKAARSSAPTESAQNITGAPTSPEQGWKRSRLNLGAPCCRREERVEEACWCLSLQLRCYLRPYGRSVRSDYGAARPSQRKGSRQRSSSPSSQQRFLPSSHSPRW